MEEEMRTTDRTEELVVSWFEIRNDALNRTGFYPLVRGYLADGWSFIDRGQLSLVDFALQEAKLLGTLYDRVDQVIEELGDNALTEEQHGILKIVLTSALAAWLRS
jgi:hypothetical protein